MGIFVNSGWSLAYLRESEPWVQRLCGSILAAQEVLRADMFGRLSAIENTYLALWRKHPRGWSVTRSGWDAEEVCLLLSAIGIFIPSSGCMQHRPGEQRATRKHQGYSSIYISASVEMSRALPDTGNPLFSVPIPFP
jgi:hypothetical protein